MTDRVSVHHLRFAVRSYEIDSYGHVNHAVYAGWFEEAREAFLRAGGRDYAWYPRENGLQFVVVRSEINYRVSAGPADSCEAATRIERIGGRSVTWAQDLRRADGVALADARTVMVFANGGRAFPPPPDFLARFEPTFRASDSFGAP